MKANNIIALSNSENILEKAKESMSANKKYFTSDISTIFNLYQTSHIDIIQIYANLPGSIPGDTKKDIESVLTSKFESSSIRHVYHLFYFICTLYLNHTNAQSLNIYAELKSLIYKSKVEDVSILDFILSICASQNEESEQPRVFMLNSKYEWDLSQNATSINLYILSNTHIPNAENRAIHTINESIIEDAQRFNRLLDENLLENHISYYKKKVPSSIKTTLETNEVEPNFFVVGIPRTGTSLLSSLLNNHPDIYCAQDSGIFNEFSNAMQTIIQLKKVNRNEISLQQARELIPILDERIGETIRSKLITPTDSESKLLLCVYITNLFRFYIYDYSMPDPRKDRDTGERYLNRIDLDLLFSKILKGNMTFVNVFNTLISFLSQDNTDKHPTLIGEKTPLGLIKNDYIKAIYPNAKFVNIIRHPIGFYGSRSQRLKTTTEDHCNFYKIGFGHMDLEYEKSITTKYENIIENESGEMAQIFSFLGVKEHNSHVDFDPGVYNKYVGRNIDKERNTKNTNCVKEEDRAIIYDRLNDIIEKFYNHEYF